MNANRTMVLLSSKLRRSKDELIWSTKQLKRMSLRLRDKACETLYLFTKRVRETALIMIQMEGHTDRIKDIT